MTCDSMHSVLPGRAIARKRARQTVKEDPCSTRDRDGMLSLIPCGVCLQDPEGFRRVWETLGLAPCLDPIHSSGLRSFLSARDGVYELDGARPARGVREGVDALLVEKVPVQEGEGSVCVRQRAERERRG